MPQIEVNEEQVLKALEQFSPAAKRRALARLIPGLAQLDRLVEQNRPRLEAICRERGINFDALTEEQRERFIDDLLHSDT
jgi:hypothetical protein